MNKNTNMSSSPAGVEDLLQSSTMQNHINIMMGTFSKLVSCIDDMDKFRDILLNLQDTHRTVPDDVKKYLTKDTFGEVLASLHVSIEILNAKYTRSERHSVIIFLETIYYMMTYFFPKGI